MKVPKLPSLQHVVRLCRPTPQQVCKEVIKLIDGTPPFSYEMLYTLAFQAARFGDGVEQLKKCVELREKRPIIQQDFKAILGLIHCELKAKPPQFVQEVTAQYYGLGRDLLVPFRPPMVIGYGRDMVLPWFMFWKDRALDESQMSLFATIVKDQMGQHPDLENCELQFWDLSRLDKKSPRTLKIVSSTDIPLLSTDQVRSALDTFINGFNLAIDEVKKRGPVADKTANTAEFPSTQKNLFED